MRSPWLSPIVGFVMFLMFALFALGLPILFLSCLLDTDIGGLNFGIISSASMWLAVMGLCGLVVSVTGFALGVWHFAQRTRPLWPSFIGICFGAWNTALWITLPILYPLLRVR